MTRPLRLLSAAIVVVSAGCDSGVDFDADVSGKVFGRAGGALGSVFQVTVDFRDAGAVSMLATEEQDGTLVKEAVASCDLGDPEQGLFETRVPGSNCVFEATVGDEELPETPESLVMGLRNYNADDKELELDPSLEVDLPSPFSFIDSYNVLEEVE